MKRKIFFIFSFLFILGMFLLPVQGIAQENSKGKVCATYFTAVGCPNCAHTDPIVLKEWPEEYKDLVILEYMWENGEWKSPNAQFFGNFARKYQTQAGVPQIIFSQKRIRLGRINVPKAKKDIHILNSNPCPLKKRSVSFADLALSELPARPKIWVNQRILIKKEEGKWLFQWNGEEISKDIKGEQKTSGELLKNLLFTKNVSKTLQGHKFTIVKPEKALFSGSDFPNSDHKSYASFDHAVRLSLSPDTSARKEGAVANKEHNSQNYASPASPGKKVKVPLLGTIHTQNFSLPILTFLLGLADGFNPCAFFVLTFLLAALIGLAGARKKIFIVGGIFIFFSALFYLLFMAVLFNVFQLGQGVTILTAIAGTIALIAGALNIKDYFAFQKGLSLTMPKSVKETFMQRVKKLSLAKSTWVLVISSVIIAATVNLYELLCTFGFPMVYTGILTLRDLSSVQYYLYLVFYNLVYILPLATIVIVFAATLGRKTFSQLWVKRLKLVSGFMIVFLGAVLIINPQMLESAITAFGVLGAALVAAGIVFLTKYLYTKSKSTSEEKDNNSENDN